ncbi:hypothetical protein NY483_23645, partial [Salmonella enterica subsp. enterica serovar Typhimurium]|uniref:hypothetical protein n=1 Tax=Salmonella enterica TaxID=28901 RepID=UPI00217635CD
MAEHLPAHGKWGMNSLLFFSFLFFALLCFALLGKPSPIELSLSQVTTFHTYSSDSLSHST